VWTGKNKQENKKKLEKTKKYSKEMEEKGKGQDEE
jgi:hypothetical protein